MKRLTIVLAVCVTLSACGSPPPALNLTESTATATLTSVQSTADRCKALDGGRLGSATIESAKLVKEGDALIGFFRRMFVKIFIWRGMPKIEAPMDFCQVTAKLRPEPGSEITAEIWLPERWNSKLLAIGGGGFNGGLSSAFLSLLEPLGEGYAGLATDAGHEESNSAKFAYDSRQQFIDYGYRANHVAASFGKDLIAAYYGAPVERAYFNGCSNGGRDALMEAWRFPEDYDGIIAGAPAAGFSKLMTAFAWNHQAALSAPNLRDKLTLVQDAVIRKCDALDGVEDQLLENPQNCPFDPAELQCAAGDAADCLTVAEVNALRKIYDGPRLSDGTQVYPGQPVGGEGLPGNWDSWIFGEEPVAGSMAIEAFRWMVHGDPEWDIDQFDIDRDYALAMERAEPILDSDNPDLSAFLERGGKLLMYHGWNDAAIPGGATTEYHAALRETVGAVVDEQVRLFMAPGLMHCGGGVGATSFDMLSALEQWVESGEAPNQIIATEFEVPKVFGLGVDSDVVRTRPLCPWPAVAHYNGTGSTDEAENFSCK